MAFLNLSEVKAGVIETTTIKQKTFSCDLSPDWSTHNTLIPITQAYENGYYYTYFHYLSSKQTLFQTDPSVYAYKVTAKLNGYNGSSTIWTSPVLGTDSELKTGDCVFGSRLSYGATNTFWYVSNYSDVEVFFAFMSYMNSFSTETGEVFTCDVNYTYYVDFTIEPYYTSQLFEMEKDLQDEQNTIIQEGNDIAQEGNDIAQEGNQIAQEAADNQKNFFASFFDNLISSVTGLFVPSAEELDFLLDDLNSFFYQTFGFLYYPFDFLIRFFDVFLNSKADYGVTLTFPGFSLMGYQIWDDMEVPVIQGGTSFYYVFEYVRVGTGILLSVWFIQYLRRFFERTFGGN